MKYNESRISLYITFQHFFSIYKYHISSCHKILLIVALIILDFFQSNLSESIVISNRHKYCAAPSRTSDKTSFIDCKYSIQFKNNYFPETCTILRELMGIIETSVYVYDKVYMHILDGRNLFLLYNYQLVINLDIHVCDHSSLVTYYVYHIYHTFTIVRFLQLSFTVAVYL